MSTFSVCRQDGIALAAAVDPLGRTIHKRFDAGEIRWSHCSLDNMKAWIRRLVLVVAQQGETAPKQVGSEPQHWMDDLAAKMAAGSLGEGDVEWGRGWREGREQERRQKKAREEAADPDRTHLAMLPEA